MGQNEVGVEPTNLMVVFKAALKFYGSDSAFPCNVQTQAPGLKGATFFSSFLIIPILDHRSALPGTENPILDREALPTA